MRNILSFILILLIILSTFPIFIPQVKADGTIYIRADGSVDPPSTSIQRDGDVYTFTDNLYNSIIVEKDDIIINGAGYTLKGTGSGKGIDLTYRSNVTVKDIKIADFEWGIYLNDSSDNTLSNNTATNNGWGGIWLERSANNVISGNTISSSYRGIWLDSSSNNKISGNTVLNNDYGVQLHRSSGNVLSGNTILYNKFGIDLWYSTENVLSSNTVSSNYYFGITLDCSSYNVVFGNTISYNNYGIHLYEYGFQCYTRNNKIYHNNFIDNTWFQTHLGGVLGYANTWDDGYPSGGNYWSNHEFVDEFSGPNQDEPGPDGICDKPYIIDSNNRDNYPLMKPWSPVIGDFEISVSPKFQTVNPGDSVSYIVMLTSLNDFTSSVELGLSGLEDVSEASYSFDPTSVVPDGSSTLTITTSSDTPLGQYTIKITGRSGYITHSKTVTLIVGKAIEIEINPFWIKKDCDTLSDDDWHGAADPYFKMKLAGDDEWFRSPKDGKEVWIGEDQMGNSFLGPIYIPRKLLKFPASLMIQAWDNDPFSDDSLGEKTFIINELPFVDKMENDEIYMLVTVREAPATLFNKVYQVDDQRNSNQWYWFEVGANFVWKGVEECEYSLDEVIVAVIDTGVNYTHPDLDANIWQNLDEIPNNNNDDDGNGFIDDWNGFDFVDGYQDILGWHQDEDGPMDKGFISEGIRFYHGTEIAGILAAERNDIGIVGVSPNVKIMPIRVMSEHQLSDSFKIGEAIRYAVDNGAKVISMSFEKNSGTSLYLDDIEYAYKSGVTLVAAAGNDRSSREVYPAAFEKVVSASGLSRVEWVSNDQLSYTHTPSEISYLMFHDDLSNYGPSPLSPKLSIEFSAPSMLLDTTSTSPPFTWATMGTSYSSPIVSAVAAVVIGYALHNYPDVELNPNEVRYILEESANDLGPVGWDPYYGYGVVNAYRALQKVDELLGNEGWQIELDPPSNLDLHVYDTFGRHIGLNYETGELEVEIPEAIHTGDETEGFETIFLPLEVTDFQVKIVNRDLPDPVEFTLDMASFDASGNLIMEETRYGSVQANSEVVYTVEATETGDFYSFEFSITGDKFFKPSEMKFKRKGAVMSRTNITNVGELDVAELSFEDKILDGWTIKDGDHTISVTLYIDSVKYKIPYDELDYVAVEDGKYIVYINFTAGVDLYQFNATSGIEEYRMTIYSFEHGWTLEIKYPMLPPRDLLAGDYEQIVLVTVMSSQAITITVEDTAVLHVT